MKYYVVFEGRQQGVYEDWLDAQDQVENFPGAKFKAYSTQEEAVAALRKYMALSDDIPLGALLSQMPSTPTAQLPPEVDPDGWAVDASCLGNPGRMEYRGVSLRTGEEIFRLGPFEDATNNIGEFLAIVHALALQYREGSRHTIYSDSVSGMSWVRRRQIKTTLQPTARNTRVFELMSRALAWLRTHNVTTPILKWQTSLWGEIPADFNRK